MGPPGRPNEELGLGVMVFGALMSSLGVLGAASFTLTSGGLLVAFRVAGMSLVGVLALVALPPVLGTAAGIAGLLSNPSSTWRAWAWGSIAAAPTIAFLAGLALGRFA